MNEISTNESLQKSLCSPSSLRGGFLKPHVQHEEHYSIEPKIIKITGVPAMTERPNEYRAFGLPAAHIFKIREGNIYEIEVIGYIAEHEMTNGWEWIIASDNL